MGTLSIVSTPIGNLDDISIRAIHTLFSVDVIATEDTRQTGKLLALLKERFGPVFPEIVDKQPICIPYYDRIEVNALPLLIDKLMNGQSVALVSDAGTPLVSDPGYRLVQAAQKRQIPVVAIPGASAVLSALVTSGMPVNTWAFLGFLPEKQSHRIAFLQKLSTNTPMTYICYSSPHKINRELDDMMAVFGKGKPVTIARELTKIHEQTWHGTLEEAQKEFSHPIGEFVILF